MSTLQTQSYDCRIVTHHKENLEQSGVITRITHTLIGEELSSMASVIWDDGAARTALGISLIDLDDLVFSEVYTDLTAVSKTNVSSKCSILGEVVFLTQSPTGELTPKHFVDVIFEETGEFKTVLPTDIITDQVELDYDGDEDDEDEDEDDEDYDEIDEEVGAVIDEVANTPVNVTDLPSGSPALQELGKM